MTSDFAYWLMNSEFAHGMITGGVATMIGCVVGKLMNP